MRSRSVVSALRAELGYHLVAVDSLCRQDHACYLPHGHHLCLWLIIIYMFTLTSGFQDPNHNAASYWILGLVPRLRMMNRRRLIE